MAQHMHVLHAQLLYTMPDGDELFSTRDDGLGNQIPKHLFASNFDEFDRTFLPEGALTQLITLDTIMSELDRFEEGLHLLNAPIREKQRAEYSSVFRQRLASWILDEAPRTFATMIHCNLNPLYLLISMRRCRDYSFTDNNLPLLKATDLPRGWYTTIWDQAQLQDFYDKQWRFLVPVFKPGRYNYDHQYNTIFPFIKLNEPPRSGAFSSVYRVRIHPHHHRHDSVDDVSSEIDLY